MLLASVFLASNVSAMQLTKAQLDKGIKKYMKEVPQCQAIKVIADQQVGESWFYTLRGNVDVDIVVGLEGGRVQRIEAISADRNDGAMRDMMCLTVGLMRGIQPEYVSIEDALKEGTHLWSGAAQKPFKKAFYFDTFTAKLTPLSLVVE
ncbi:hypothetical protein D3M96_14315 [Alcaligenes aquatilis]|uniref:Uncharacterized protein n=2 Tax=Alcaligenes aquatilis TaxID=323284 RepID=A0A3G2HWQ4_9BURK|nr:hypothetical protein D3M96_14315 [Alcaligenes aquatilis]